MFVVADTAVVSAFLKSKGNLGYDTAKQQMFSLGVQPDQLAHTLGCLVLYCSNATSESLVDHGRTPARFALSTRGTLRIAKPPAVYCSRSDRNTDQRYDARIHLRTDSTYQTGSFRCFQNVVPKPAAPQ